MTSAEGFVVWFTWLSGSGKSTLTSMLASEVSWQAMHVESLDGDVVRTNLSKGLGFSREDRDTNIRALALWQAPRSLGRLRDCGRDQRLSG
jgi:adenylylsulfate kinase-like enzyme